MALPQTTVREKKFSKNTAVTNMKEVERQETYEDKAYKQELARLRAQREYQEQQRGETVGKFKARAQNLGTVARTATSEAIAKYMAERARRSKLRRKARMSVEDKIIIAQAKQEALARAGYGQANRMGVGQQSVLLNPSQTQASIYQMGGGGLSLYTGGAKSNAFTSTKTPSTSLFTGSGSKKKGFRWF